MNVTTIANLDAIISDLRNEIKKLRSVATSGVIKEYADYNSIPDNLPIGSLVYVSALDQLVYKKSDGFLYFVNLNQD